MFRLSPVHFLTDLSTSNQVLVRLKSTDYFRSIMNQNESHSPHLSADRDKKFDRNLFTSGASTAQSVGD